MSNNQMVKLLYSQIKRFSEVLGVWLEFELDRHVIDWLLLSHKMTLVSDLFST